MSFGKQSDVHDHLSTKHPLIPRKNIGDDVPAKVIEPVQNPEPVTVNIPEAPVEESTVGSF